MPSDDDKDAGEEPTSQNRWSPNKMLLLGYLLLLLLFTGGGFGLGQHLQVCPNAPPPKDGFYTAYSVLRTFDLNLTYAKKPTNATDQAWLDLYPSECIRPDLFNSFTRRSIWDTSLTFRNPGS